MWPLRAAVVTDDLVRRVNKEEEEEEVKEDIDDDSDEADVTTTAVDRLSLKLTLCQTARQMLA